MPELIELLPEGLKLAVNFSGETLVKRLHVVRWPRIFTDIRIATFATGVTGLHVNHG